MTDNINITQGSGIQIATDDVSGVQFQKIKLDGGDDGLTQPITGTTANGLDVDVTRVQGTVTVDSELAVAAELTDNGDNPEITSVGAFGHVFDGAEWHRTRGDMTNGLDVDVTRVQGTVTVDSELPTAAILADGAANPTAPFVGSGVSIYNGSTWDRLRGLSGVSDASTGLGVVPTGRLLFNGTTYDRERGNVAVGAHFNVAGGTATQTGSTQTNYNAKGVQFFLNVATAQVGSPINLLVQAVDPDAGIAVATLVAFGTVTATGGYAYTLYPGISETISQANHEAQALVLPRKWRAVVNHAGSSPWDYTLSYSYIN